MTNPSRRIPAPRPHSLEVDARYVLLARWAKGRNVLDMGGASCRALALLVNAGARKLVVATDSPDALRRELQGAGLDGVEVVAAAAASTPFVDQAFDLVVFHDFAVQAKEQPAWHQEIRRILAPDGLFVLTLPNAKGHFLSELGRMRFSPGTTFEELYARLSPDFGAATVFGQSPVVASLFFDFASDDEDMGMAFDRSLLTDDAEEPGWHVVMFGPDRPSLTDLDIVQLPFEPVVAYVKDRFRPTLPRAVTRASTRVTLKMAPPTAVRNDVEMDRLRRYNAVLVQQQEETYAYARRLLGEYNECRSQVRDQSEELKKVYKQEGDLIAELESTRQQLITVTVELETVRSQAASDDERAAQAAQNQVLRDRLGALESELRAAKPVTSIEPANTEKTL